MARAPGRDPRPEPLGAPAALGVAVGVLSGLFGVGGGVLIVPGLVLLTRMGQRRAHATSLAAIAPVAAAGAAGYALAAAVDWPAALVVGLASAAGAAVGTRALLRIPERWLARGFVLFLLVAAVAFPFEAEASGRVVDLTTPTTLTLVAIGFVAGSLAGVLGVGGGIVTIPALSLLLAVSPVVAKGTSLVVIIPTAIAGTIANVRAGTADLRVAAAVALPGALVAVLSSFVAVRLDPVVSAVLFAALLVAIAARMWLSRPAGRAR